MRKHELTRFLKENGYRFLKVGGKHEHWGRGRHKIILSLGRSVDDRLSKKIMLDAKRGFARRYCEEQ